MWKVQNISRRDFLKSTGATTALVLGANFVPHSLIAAAEAATGSVQPNLFVRIDPRRYRDTHVQPFRDGSGSAHGLTDDPSR